MQGQMSHCHEAAARTEAREVFGEHLTVLSTNDETAST